MLGRNVQECRLAGVESVESWWARGARRFRVFFFSSGVVFLWAVVAESKFGGKKGYWRRECLGRGWRRSGLEHLWSAFRVLFWLALLMRGGCFLSCWRGVALGVVTRWDSSDRHVERSASMPDQCVRAAIAIARWSLGQALGKGERKKKAIVSYESEFFFLCFVNVIVMIVMMVAVVLWQTEIFCRGRGLL